MHTTLPRIEVYFSFFRRKTMYLKKIVLILLLVPCSLILANGKLNEYEQAKSSIEDIIHSHSLVVLDFWAPWCPPCRALTPLLEKFAKENPDIYILKINTQDYQYLCKKYGISAIPVLMLFKDGKRIATKSGKPSSLKELTKFILDSFKK